MNKKTIGSIFTAGILLCQTSIAATHCNPNSFHIPAYYAQGGIVAFSPPSSPYIYVQRNSTNSTLSSWSNPSAGGAFNNWYQNKVWVPGYTIVRGNQAQWVPGGWVYRQ
ncbi:hypothetical protein BH10PSE19_BH10PSE19_16570 [soil metagenome]